VERNLILKYKEKDSLERKRRCKF